MIANFALAIPVSYNNLLMVIVTDRRCLLANIFETVE